MEKNHMGLVGAAQIYWICQMKLKEQEERMRNNPK